MDININIQFQLSLPYKALTAKEKLEKKIVDIVKESN